MSVTATREIWTGRDGEGTTKANTYTRVFRVETNNALDDWTTVRGSTTLPQVGDLYPFDIFARCVSARGNNESFSPKVWICTFRYSTSTDSRDTNPDPLDDTPIITWSTQRHEVPAVRDQSTGKLITNTAGDPFDPPLMHPEHWGQITIRANESGVPSYVSTLGAVNSATVTIDGQSFTAYEVLVDSIEIGPKQTRNEIEFREVTITLLTNERAAVKSISEPSLGWREEVVNVGFRYLDPEDDFKAKEALNDGDQTPVKEPVFLDIDGSLLPNPGPENFVTEIFNVHPTADLTAIPGVS